ncbi:MAG: Ig-like domain-containing protein [Anaerolineaceae bacterium]
MKSNVTRVIAMMVLLSMIVAPVSAQSTPPTGPRIPIADRSGFLGEPAADGVQKFVQETGITSYEVDGKEPVRYVVILTDKPLATYKGEIAGLSATAPSVTGAKLNVKSPESQAYLEYLKGQQATYLAVAKNVLGYEPKVLFQYQYATNGFSMMLTAAEAELLAAQTGAKVLRAPIETPDTDEGPTWIGAPAIWDGETASGVATKGEGILVGIIDTGINFDHPSFSATPADEFVYDWTGDYLGVCAPTGDPAYATACNDKLIGAFTYVADDPVETSSPEDSEGHGSHTASTVAGNVVEVVDQGVTTTISGVAPHAQIIAFDVCVPEEPNGACFSDATVMAVDDAIASGVDVINYSISGGANPYGDPVELAFLAATEAGIFVSTSAGNEGDTTGESSVAHRSPWVSTVAAATHARIFYTDVNFSNTLYQNIPTLPGELPFNSDLVNSLVKFAGEDGNPLGCVNPGYATPNFYDGAIALIKRGTCTFTEKVLAAEAAGASGVFIFTNASAAVPMGVSGSNVPNVMLDIPGATGDAIAAWVASATDDTVSTTGGAIIDPASADIIADFSSFGPNTTFDVLKPDITAPGVSILAAVADGTITPGPKVELALYQGTSMSSPHNAGAAALVMALHPDWTPMQVRSAMMMTAQDGLIADRSALGEGVRPATPQDEGAGRVALQNTALVGLVMGESIANFEAADPTLDGDPATLNLASLYSSKCVGICTWTRTFKSVSGLPATYIAVAPAWVTVTPNEFTIAAGGSQEVTFTADVGALETDVWQYAKVEFNTTGTHAGLSTTLFTENFSAETFPPTGWAVYNYDTQATNWIRDIAQSKSAPASARHSYGCSADQDGWLVTPQIPVHADGSTLLNFYQRGDWTADMVYHGILVSTGSGDPAVGPFVEVAQPATPPEDAWTAAPISVDLTAYAGQNIYIAFNYTGNCADTWWIDDVEVVNIGAGPAISDAHIPLAVLPTASNIPALVKFDSHRDADGATLSDLMAVELTGANTFNTGLAKAELDSFLLDPDPTPGNAMDDLTQVFVKKLTVPAYTIRLVAEITASTSSDIDMFLYWDANGDGLLSGADYLLASSATGAVLEYINAPKDFVYYNQPDTFFVVVQNWAGTAGDSVTLAVGMVPVVPPMDNYEVVLPVTNPAGAPFSMDILWNEDTQEGDRLYGYFETYADETGTIFIGGTDIDIHRLADDVVKTANVEAAKPGDVVTYSIEVNNFTTEPLAYTINDVLPVGVTYVPDSVTGGAVYDSVNNAITWSGPVAASYRDYVATTSAADAACTLAIMADGDPTDDYLDWKTTSYGFSTASSISGDSFWNHQFDTYPPFNYYGVDYNGMEYTDDGYVGFDMVDVDYVNQNLPDPIDPNNVLAMFWDDFVVQYDAATNKGVTMVGDNSSFATVEYDDLYLWGEDPTVTLDLEIGYFLQPDDAPGAYEIVYAYDNIHPDLLANVSATIGLENVDGTKANLISYNDPALTIEDGSAICFDWALLPAPPVVITFQVTVDEDAVSGLLTNEALHDNDALGSLEESAKAVVEINYAPVAVADAYTTVEDTQLVVAAPGVLANDTDEEGDPLTAELVTSVTNGTLALAADGSFIYMPDLDFVGDDTFTYQAFDGTFSSAPVTVTITVTPVNDAPVAVDDYYWTDFETVLNVPALEGVLANDNDPDPTDKIVLELVESTVNGLLVFNPDGSFDYTPNTGYRGIDTFVYRFFGMPTIQSEWFDEATVYITVNDVPLALDQSLETTEDTPLAITLSGDFLLPGDVVWTIATQPEHGTLNGTGPELVYTPAPNWYGSDAFTFMVNDGLQDSNIATISITVLPINDAPSAEDDYYVTPQNTVLDVSAPGVLANDVELDPTDILYADLFEGPKNGTVVLNQDGSFTYTPNAGFFGLDSFSYLMLGIPSGNSILSQYQDDAVVYITVLPAVTIFLPMIIK